MSKITQAEIEYIIKKKQEGFGSRWIASVLDRSKSAVNEIYNKYLNDQLYDGQVPIVVTETPIESLKEPKILFLDIETAADISATFGRFKVNIGQDNIIHEGGWLLSVAWKFNSEETRSAVLTHDEALSKDDSRIVALIYELLEQADVVVAQNGDRFDLPKIKTRMAIHAFPAPKKVKTVDTLKIAKQMGFNSNKLDSLGVVLGVGRKLKHEGINLWIECQRGNQEALELMQEYNMQDVDLLYNVYHRLKHFDAKAPNMALFYDDEHQRCHVCGSTNVEETGNSVFTQVSEFAEVHCKDCGSRGRKRTILNSKEKRNNLIMP